MPREIVMLSECVSSPMYDLIIVLDLSTDMAHTKTYRISLESTLVKLGISLMVSRFSDCFQPVLSIGK